MKKAISCATTVALVVCLLAGCGGGANVSQDEAEKAFVIGYAAVFMASMGGALGGTTEGVMFNEDKNKDNRRR